MQATTDHPLDHVREALDTLREHRDWIPDAGKGPRGFALAEVVRNWKAGADDATWEAVAALIPPRRSDAPDPASEEIRRHAVTFLKALDDCEYERRDGGLSLATYERMRRAHTAIGHTIDLIQLDA